MHLTRTLTTVLSMKRFSIAALLATSLQSQAVTSAEFLSLKTLCVERVCLGASAQDLRQLPGTILKEIKWREQKDSCQSVPNPSVNLTLLTALGLELDVGLWARPNLPLNQWLVSFVGVKPATSAKSAEAFAASLAEEMKLDRPSDSLQFYQRVVGSAGTVVLSLSPSLLTTQKNYNALLLTLAASDSLISVWKTLAKCE